MKQKLMEQLENNEKKQHGLLSMATRLFLTKVVNTMEMEEV